MMGCSPSRGQPFAGLHKDKALQFGSYESNSHHFSGGTEIKSQTETDIGSCGLGLLQEENTAVPLQGKTVCDIVRGSGTIVETNGHSQGELLTKENEDSEDDRSVKNNGCKRRRHRGRLRKTVYMQSELDLPQDGVKPHQAAYTYLQHNITKYESLLVLLKKATQTQRSLQPMVTFLALQYEQINQALNEIATEGEQMLEMHGNHMALLAAQNDVLLNLDTLEAEMNSTASSPDLLQHMLHHSIQRNKLIGDSVKEIGDTSLEEISNYFGSISQLLAGKLQAKRTMELHLKQVLACVESYALRRPNSEDSALHSEDSGIGVENRCHNGSVQDCSHQESSGSGASTRSSYGCPEGSLSDQPYVNGDEADDFDKDAEAEGNNGVEEAREREQGSKTDLIERKMSNWSHHSDPSQYPLQVNLQNKRPTNIFLQWSDQKERNIIRPKTAGDSSVSCQRKHRHSHFWGAQRSRSADCLCRGVKDYMVQEQIRFPSDKKPKWIKNRQNPQNTQFPCLQNGNNGPFQPGLTPSLTPAFAPVPPGKNAVRRLIHTFSQGVCDSPKQKPMNGPTRFRGRKTSFLPIITNCRASVSTNGKKNTNSYSLDQQFAERRDDVDVNSFPPPPPELLMDNSFEKNEGPAGAAEGSENQIQRSLTQSQNCCVSQCPQASMQHQFSLHPSQDKISGCSQNISETCPNGQDLVVDQPTVDKDKENDEAIGHFQDSQKSVHLYHSSDILDKLGQWDGGNIKLLSESVEGMGNRDTGEAEASTHYVNSHPPTTPPVFKAQIPPSRYYTCHRVPSPSALPPSSTCPVNGQGETSTASFTSQIPKDENGLMIASSSISFYDARSVFCQENQSAYQFIKPSCRSTLPRPWGERKVSRGKLQATCLPQTFRRSRPTLTDHQPLLSSITEQCNQDSKSTTLNNGRKEHVAETTLCSRQEIPLSCSVSGPQEAEAKITDKRD